MAKFVFCSSKGSLCSFAVLLNSALLFSCQQSAPSSKVKIIGGQQATQEYPFFVSLTDGDADSRFCGATYIGERVVVTAAHCSVQPSQNLSVRFESAEQAVEIPVKRLLVHENYDPARLVNDVAIMLLSEDAPAFAKPAALSKEIVADTPAGKSLKVIGYGNMTSIGWIGPKALREVMVPVLEAKLCADPYSPNFDPARQVCAGSAEGGVDSCQGDSGGPLFSTAEDGSFLLEGIVSYGNGCAQKEFPGVYTRVSAFNNWITENSAKLRKSLLAADAETLGRMAAQNCVSAFNSVTSFGGRKASLSESREITLNGPFEALKNDRFKGKVEKEPACVANLEDGTEVKFYLAQSVSDRRNEKFQIVAKVAGERGYSFVAPTKYYSSYNMYCTERGGNDISWNLDGNYGYSSFTFSGGRFNGTIETTQGALVNSKTLARCKVGAAEFVFQSGEFAPNDGTLAEGNAAASQRTGEPAYLLTVSNLESAGPGASRTSILKYLLQKAPEEETAPLLLALVNGTDNQSELEIANVSNEDLYGWQMSCEKKIDLFRNNGTLFQPELDDQGLYNYSSFEPEQSESAILRDEKLRLRVKFSPAEGNDSSSVYCSVNGFGTELNFPAAQ